MSSYTKLDLTNSHRPSLLKYHNRHLRLGDSATAPPGSPLASTTALPALLNKEQPTRAQGWQLTELGKASAAEQMELDKEIEQLERILDNEVVQWESRLAVVNRDLTSGGSTGQASSEQVVG